MSLFTGDLSISLVFDNTTLLESTEGLPQSRPPALHHETRGRSALLSAVAYSTCRRTVGRNFFALLPLILICLNALTPQQNYRKIVR